MPIETKRVYELTGADEGYRILVDRIWPRGIKKDTLHLDAWLKEISPTTTLRKWFNHDPTKWMEFVKRYKKELLSHQRVLREIQRLAQQQPVLLLYSARDTEHNQARVLKEIIDNL